MERTRETDKGHGGEGKGTNGMKRACFICGSTDHLMRDCPQNTQSTAKIQQIEEEDSEILFISQVQDRRDGGGWDRVPMKETLGDYMTKRGEREVQEEERAGREEEEQSGGEHVQATPGR